MTDAHLKMLSEAALLIDPQNATFEQDDALDAFRDAANPATILRLLRERDEALQQAHTSDKFHGAADLACQLAEAQRDEVRDALEHSQMETEAQKEFAEFARKERDVARAQPSLRRYLQLTEEYASESAKQILDLSRLIAIEKEREELHRAALDADQGEGEGT